MLKECRRSAQGVPNIAKMVPLGCPRDAPGMPQDDVPGMAPGWPKRPRDIPKRAQDDPKMSQDGFKSRLKTFPRIAWTRQGLGFSFKNLDFEGLNFLGINFLGLSWGVTNNKETPLC